MSRIIVTSDLHLGISTVQEIQALAEQIASAQPDLTVLAGDLGEGLTNIRAACACSPTYRDRWRSWRATTTCGRISTMHRRPFGKSCCPR